MTSQPTSPETTVLEAEAEKRLTPKQSALSAARSEVLKHEEELLEAVPLLKK